MTQTVRPASNSQTLARVPIESKARALNLEKRRSDERRKYGSGTVWWGEATDEPARADARPTENANCTTDRKYRVTPPRLWKPERRAALTQKYPYHVNVATGLQSPSL